MRKKILVSAGPIPANLDSVKLITNKFKGGLALKTAIALANNHNPHMTDGFDVTIVKWVRTDLDVDRERGSSIPEDIINVKDVYEYYNVIKDTEADAYILAAAVANLAPSLPLPWGDGKFPSHLYKEGDKFNIEFTIVPRSIDMVKRWHPKSTLIGYKLFDGTEEELMDAAWHTLVDSRSNVVFANHPKTAKLHKIALMPDGTHMRMTFDEHVEFIRRVIELKWYHTEIKPLDEVLDHNPSDEQIRLLQSLINRIAVKKGEYSFGTAAIRLVPFATKGYQQFLTTTRGKREDGHCVVQKVRDDTKTVFADKKATLNAPTLNTIFLLYPEVNYILHGHRQIQMEHVKTLPYAFSGTTEENGTVHEVLHPPGSHSISKAPLFNVQNHGYYACFRSLEKMNVWLDKIYGK